MRFATIWQRLLGVERTVVEQVVFDEDEGAIVASVRPARAPPAAAGCVNVAAPGMTGARVGGGGGPSISGRSRPSWRLTPRGCRVRPMGWSWWRSPGLVTGLATA